MKKFSDRKRYRKGKEKPWITDEEALILMAVMWLINAIFWLSNPPNDLFVVIIISFIGGAWLAYIFLYTLFILLRERE